MTTTIHPLAPECLSCSYCGGETIGRQFWNRDAGTGLCDSCHDWLASRHGTSPEEMARTYGEVGVHVKLTQEKLS